MVNHKVKALLLTMIVTFIIVSLVLCICLYKPSVHTASYDELVMIEGLGEVLSTRIESFLDLNPNADIEDLLAIEGIGIKRLELIKTKYR